MHVNYGSYSGSASDTQKIIIASAGPLFSLFQGWVFLFLSRRIVQKNILSLFFLWLSFHGFILFFGYVICSPFFIYGDIGQVFYLLHLPIYFTVAISIIFVFGLIKLLHRLAKDFEHYGQGIINIKSRLGQLILYPLIIGGIISLILQLPVPNFLLLFAGITTPLMFLFVYGKLRDNNNDHPTVSIERLSIPLVIIITLTVVVARLLV